MGLDSLQLVQAPVQLLQGLQGHPEEGLIWQDRNQMKTTIENQWFYFTSQRGWMEVGRVLNLTCKVLAGLL